MKNREIKDGLIYETLIDKIPEREDAFWYLGDDIARVQFPNGKKLYAETSGEIRVLFEEDGTWLKGIQAVEHAIDNNLTDVDLDKLNEHDGWGMNNWFAIHEYDINGECISDDLGICHDYDEAIKLLKAVAEEKQKEYYS
tara:strand:- start:266 stop:685 length:420 start_codon:yes stop_codon:yes gene_type:complete